jgi:hypothetical protein
MKVLQAAICIACLLLSTVSLHAQKNSTYELDETYSINKEGTIHLNSNDAEVSIKGTDRSDVHVKVYHSVDIDGWKISSEGKFKMSVENKNGDLYIDEAESANHMVMFGKIEEEYRITIEAPHSTSLNINGDDDTYEIVDISGLLNIDADDSVIDLRGLQGKQFGFNLDDGTIEMDQGQGSLNIDMDDGELNVRNADFSQIESSTDDAELNITTSLTDEGLYKFDMDDGDLELNISGGGGVFDISHDDPELSAGNNFEEVSSDEDNSGYSLAGGNARIKIDVDDADISLQTI